MVCLDVYLLLLIIHNDIDSLIHMADKASIDGDFELSYTSIRPISLPFCSIEDSRILCMGDHEILVPKYGPTNP
jgi:hypothetical protein